MNKNLRVENSKKKTIFNPYCHFQMKVRLVVNMFQSDPMLENIIKAAHLYLLLPLVMIIRKLNALPVWKV